jgi:hypothetical protein
MKILAKIGTVLIALAAVLTVGLFGVLKAQGISPVNKTHVAARTAAAENRDLMAGITVVDLDGPIDLKLKQGAAASLNVHAEKDFMSHITTMQEGNTLKIGMKGDVFHTTGPLQVELTLPALEKLSVRGSGDSVVAGFKGEKLILVLNGSGNLTFNGQYQQINADSHGSGDLTLNSGASNSVELNLIGSGQITASGDTKILSAKLNGSGDLNAVTLRADNVTINANGSGDSIVFAKKTANLTMNGSGDIHVKGKPERRSTSQRGSGDVDWE